jgi:hypothetical protein
MSYGSGAGAGAEEMARRAAAREAELEARLARARQTRQSWEAGAAGERAVAAALEQLAPQGWRVVHDVHWPGRPQANLDHVAVGPGGFVVVDAKNWSGKVTVVDGTLRQNGRRRQQTVDAACSAAAAVTAMLAPGHRSSVRAVVCFVQQELDAQTVPPGVVLVGLGQLIPWFTQLPRVLAPEVVDAVHAYLNRELSGARSPQLSTTAALQRAPRSRPRRQRRPSPSSVRGHRGGSTRVAQGLLKLGAAVLLLASSYYWMQSHATAPTDPAPPSGVSSTSTTP